MAIPYYDMPLSDVKIDIILNALRQKVSSNKMIHNATHFNVLDESFDKILTTLDKKGKDDSGITRIPYADMIFGLSKGKVLIQSIGRSLY